MLYLLLHEKDIVLISFGNGLLQEQKTKKKHNSLLSSPFQRAENQDAIYEAKREGSQAFRKQL